MIDEKQDEDLDQWVAVNDQAAEALGILSMLALLDHAQDPRDNFVEHATLLSTTKNELCAELETLLEEGLEAATEEDHEAVVLLNKVLHLYRGRIPAP